MSDRLQNPKQRHPKEPIAEQAINDKLGELEHMEKDPLKEKNALSSRVEELKQQIDDTSDEIDEMNAQQNAVCIAGRNEYSRRATQQDSAAGIEELDQESAQDEDPDDFNPEEDLRDYEHVAKSLPVFCVSSRAYQKLSGRLIEGSEIEEFRNISETEVPSLPKHCKKLTEKGRQASCRRFLNNVQALLTSTGLWASDDGSGVRLTSADNHFSKVLDADVADFKREKQQENTEADAVDDAIAENEMEIDDTDTDNDNAAFTDNANDTDDDDDDDDDDAAAEGDDAEVEGDNMSKSDGRDD